MSKQFLLDAAELADAWRIFPRLLLICYGYMCAHLIAWFEALKTPSTEQSAFVTVVLAMATPLIGLYVQSGRRWDKS